MNGRVVTNIGVLYLVFLVRVQLNIQMMRMSAGKFEEQQLNA